MPDKDLPDRRQIAMTRRRTEITIEFEEVIHAVSNNQRLLRAWCPECDCEAQMITPEHAAAITHLTVRAVNQRVEAGTVHFVETADGRLWVCLKSLD